MNTSSAEVRPGVGPEAGTQAGPLVDAQATQSCSACAALVLAGGGARAGYQVGVLAGLAERIPGFHTPILTGVSAGAINSTFLANSRKPMVQALQDLEQCWASLTFEEVFDVGGLSLGWRAAWNLTRLVVPLPRRLVVPSSMVDSSPLRRFLHRAYQSPSGHLPNITENVREGRLRAVALTAAHYASGRGVTFFTSRDVEPWSRPLRTSIQTDLRIDHVMASSALPMFFPAVPVDGKWYGDGGVGLVAPLSPAVHLGADRILVVSTRYRPPSDQQRSDLAEGPPSVAVIAGGLYNTLFLDQLDFDATQLGRISKFLGRLPPEERSGLRPIALHVIRPSEDMATAAGRYEDKLPPVLRHLARRLGTSHLGRQDLLSTVLFQQDYVRYLLELGRLDGSRNAEAVERLLNVAAPIGSDTSPSR